MIYKAFEFNRHNTKFYGQYWKSDHTTAVIILIHGMGEHSTRYRRSLIPEFLNHNFSVITYDQFGHGKTEGKRGHNPGYTDVLNCVEFIEEKAQILFGNIPNFLYGHSMGGNVVINYVLRRKNTFKGVIATSPFLKLAFKPPQWKLIIGKFLQTFAPSITMGNELDVNAISRDKNEVQKYIDDPLVHDKISPNYSLTFMETGVWAIENAYKLKIPLFIMHGTADRLTSFKASAELVKNSKGMATLKLFENGYHELHNDLCKNDVLNSACEWIEQQIKLN
jgi:alpha-beta hydrolase superfamily lysophospholipase